MNKRIMGVFILCVILILSCAPKPWLPQSVEKKQNIKDEVCKQIEELAEKENYFPQSIVTTMDYVHGAMNSLNKNNGEAIIIANDGLRYAKLTFVLDGDEKVNKVNVKKYSKDIVEIFRKYKIRQNRWIPMIKEFNEKGFVIKTEGEEILKLSYDFKKDSILISVPNEDEIPLPPHDVWRMITIRTR